VLGKNKRQSLVFPRRHRLRFGANRTVAALIDEMTGGEALHIILSDSIGWDGQKALAEDVLNGKRAMTDKEIVAVRKKYGD